MAKSYNQINATGSGGSGSVSAHSQTFNATSDWSGPSGGVYSITVLESSHDKGTNPIVQIFELVGSDYEEVQVDISINSNGDVTISVTENIDTRFVGKIIIL